MRHLLLLLVLTACAASPHKVPPYTPSMYDCDTRTTLVQAQIDFEKVVEAEQACLAKGGIAEVRLTEGGYLVLCKVKKGF